MEKVPSLGYVLGDEGSGAWLGKRVAADAIQGLLPKDLCRDFFSFSGLTGDEIVRRVYRPAYGEDAPNRFLAGFAPFLSCHIGRVEIRAIVEAGFRSFSGVVSHRISHQEGMLRLIRGFNCIGV